MCVMLYFIVYSKITLMQQNNDKILRKIGTRIKDLRVQNKKSLNQFAYDAEELTSATLSRI